MFSIRLQPIGFYHVFSVMSSFIEIDQKNIVRQIVWLKHIIRPTTDNVNDTGFPQDIHIGITHPSCLRLGFIDSPRLIANSRDPVTRKHEFIVFIRRESARDRIKPAKTRLRACRRVDKTKSCFGVTSALRFTFCLASHREQLRVVTPSGQSYN